MTTEGPVPGARADIAADVFDYRGLLDEHERDLLDGLRRWLRTELAPVADDCWARAEFPHQLLPGFAGLNIIGLPYDMPGTPTEGRLLSGFVGLEISRVDSSFASFYGVHSGLAMGAIYYCGDDEQRERGCRPCAGWRRSARSA